VIKRTEQLGYGQVGRGNQRERKEEHKPMPSILIAANFSLNNPSGLKAICEVLISHV
jgi:hypothetical protein